MNAIKEWMPGRGERNYTYSLRGDEIGPLVSAFRNREQDEEGLFDLGVQFTVERIRDSIEECAGGVDWLVIGPSFIAVHPREVEVLAPLGERLKAARIVDEIRWILAVELAKESGVKVIVPDMSGLFLPGTEREEIKEFVSMWRSFKIAGVDDLPADWILKFNGSVNRNIALDIPKHPFLAEEIIRPLRSLRSPDTLAGVLTLAPDLDDPILLADVYCELCDLGYSLEERINTLMPRLLNAMTACLKLHQNGILHKDIKWMNLFEDGKVFDFEIGHDIRDAVEVSYLSGPPAYLIGAHLRSEVCEDADFFYPDILYFAIMLAELIAEGESLIGRIDGGNRASDFGDQMSMLPLIELVWAARNREDAKGYMEEFERRKSTPGQLFEALKDALYDEGADEKIVRTWDVIEKMIVGLGRFDLRETLRELTAIWGDRGVYCEK